MLWCQYFGFSKLRIWNQFSVIIIIIIIIVVVAVVVILIVMVIININTIIVIVIITIVICGQPLTVWPPTYFQLAVIRLLFIVTFLPLVSWFFLQERPVGLHWAHHALCASADHHLSSESRRADDQWRAGRVGGKLNLKSWNIRKSATKVQTLGTSALIFTHNVPLPLSTFTL